MFDGFLNTRASFMLDFVFLAMFGVIPVLGWSIWQVRYKQRYLLHKRVQIVLGLVLLAAVALFELDIQLYDWKHRAASDGGEVSSTVWTALYVHLPFAISTALLWIFVIVQALRKIPNPPGPSAYSRRHILLARVAAIDMFLTALTGWIFYVLAFVL